jgi:hypothetical protein
VNDDAAKDELKDQLGIKERAALLALMAEAKEISNAELKERIGFGLDGDPRRKLNDLKLVSSQRLGKSGQYVHELTDDGWAWCARELAGAPPLHAGSVAGALYAVLAGLHRYLERNALQLSDVFVPSGEAGSREHEPKPDAESRIKAAYRSLAKERGDWVRLSRLRRLLADLPKTDVDAALQRMQRERHASLVPDSNQKMLNEEDHEAAVWIGGEFKHLLALDDP